MNKIMHHARLIFPKIVRPKYGMTCVHVLNSGSPGNTVRAGEEADSIP